MLTLALWIIPNRPTGEFDGELYDHMLHHNCPAVRLLQQLTAMTYTDNGIEFFVEIDVPTNILTDNARFFCTQNSENLSLIHI